MIPLAGDQPKNAKVAEKHGIALIVPKGEVTEEKLYNSIKEILSNPRYSSRLFSQRYLATPTLQNDSRV